VHRRVDAQAIEALASMRMKEKDGVNATVAASSPPPMPAAA
jgi:hypothetical protein